MSFKFAIDGREVEVHPGQTILQVATKLGIDIPTLCYVEKCGPMTSCLACLVKINGPNGQSRVVPSCGTKAQPGMVVESEIEEIREARRTALELLLSDHAGDCLSPCHRICPLHLNIPLMIRQIEAGQTKEAIATVKSALAMPAVLGRLCHHPCENGCRRGTWDSPAAIRELERFAADTDLYSAQPYLPPCQPATGKSVAIVGAGPTGLTAAYHLLREGHACTLIDRHETAGGTLRRQTDEKELPREFLEAEISQIEKMGARFRLGCSLGTSELADLLGRHDAVLLATGEMEKSEAVALGLVWAGSGVKADPDSYQTQTAKVFAAGSVVKPMKQVARAMSEGKAAATCIHRFLFRQKVERPDKEFSSVMGRLEADELKLFLNGPSPNPRVSPSCGLACGYTKTEACAEAQRCLHCDCRAAGQCKLQHYGALYGANPAHFRAERRRFEQHLRPGGVIFEPGKCIVCGICVRLAEQAREPLGLAFVNRGFDVRVSAPLNRTFAEGLQKVAAECVEHCPTGALAFREEASGPSNGANRADAV
ncbi:MAG: FAD-dependent oxidoreductase [Verrucomicrobia bacterium]|nr:FAD-dependent oxidoreductase [Verrucomicrobiota bacterium]